MPATDSCAAAAAAAVSLLLAAAPYLLQPLAEAFGSEPPQVKLALLTAAAKLFFRRPGESRKLLGACLAGGLNDADQDVHDRALLYYRSVHVVGLQQDTLLGGQSRWLFPQAVIA
jgi:hypothetical protein